MKRVVFFLISLIIIFSIIIFAVKDQISLKKILQNIEKDTGLNIKLRDDQKWSFFPKINYQNTTTEISWKKTAHMSRQCYLGEKSPGSYTTLPTSGLTKNIDDYNYTIEESDLGYKNFCVVENFVQSIEWLYLAAKGHRRAIFNLRKKPIEMKWLIP